MIVRALLFLDREGGARYDEKAMKRGNFYEKRKQVFRNNFMFNDDAFTSWM